MPELRPRLVVFSSLFPSSVQPNAGLFIRERMFRVGKELPIAVVAPVPWFPGQQLIGLIRPNYRPMPPKREVQEGVEVLHPRFFSVPGLFRAWDGFFMALSCLATMRQLKCGFRVDIIDAHFAYPDGYAATLLGKWLDLPVTITLRGTEVRHARITSLRKRMMAGLQRAARIFSVSESLKRHVMLLGIHEAKVLVVGNGVDAEKFFPVDRTAARAKLELPADVRVMITVGGLVERKGFHRVIECLPELLKEFPNLLYLVVGGPSAEGDWSDRLRSQVAALGLQNHVRFLGVIPPDDLKWPLSAADLFVLSTRNEGWANVFLEAMACGLPVITTDVGGNREVIARDELGTIVPFDDGAALLAALKGALNKPWERHRIIAYAHENAWSNRVQVLTEQFRQLAPRVAG